MVQIYLCASAFLYGEVRQLRRCRRNLRRITRGSIELHIFDALWLETIRDPVKKLIFSFFEDNLDLVPLFV